MKVKIENLPSTTSLESIQAEFSKCGPCKVSQQGSAFFVDYPDIVQVSRAIKDYNQKEFLGQVIRLERHDDTISLLGSRRERSRSPPQAFGAVQLNATPKSTQQLTGVISLTRETLPAQKVSVAIIQNPIVSSPIQTVSARKKVQEQVKPVERTGIDTAIPQKKSIDVEKAIPQPEDRKEEEPSIEDTMFQHEDGSKFMDIGGDKVLCIGCDKEMARNRMNQHCKTKVHKQNL